MPQPIPFDFNNEEFVAAVELRFEEAALADDMSAAHALMENLDDYLRIHPEVQQSTTALAGRRQRLRTRAAWVALPMLSDPDVVELIKRSLSTVFTLPDYNLSTKCRGLIITKVLLEERDQLKQSLRQAMLENTESFRTAKPTSEQLPQTIGGWLKHYNVYVNSKVGTSLHKAQYLTQVVGENLSSEQKKFLKILIQTFDYLKLSSTNLESDTEVMSADVGGTPMVWRAGELEEVIPPKDVIRSLERMGFLKPEPSENAASSLSTITPPAIPSNKVVPESKRTVPITTVPPLKSQPSTMKPLATPPLSKIAVAPPPPKTLIVSPPPPPTPRPSVIAVAKTDIPTASSRLLDLDVSKQTEEWQKQNVSGVKIFDLLLNAIQQKDQKIILAGLNALAESGELLQMLKADSRFYYLLANYYRHQKRLNDLKEFHMSFADPRYLKELIRYILGEQLKLSEDEAAHIGADIINLLRQKEVNIKHWSYFDMKTSTYKWL